MAGLTGLAMRQRRVRENSYDEQSRMGLGRSYAEAGRWREAAAEFRRAVELNPACPAAWRSLAEALIWSGAPAEAAETLRHGILVSERAGDIRAEEQMKVLLARLQKESD